MGGGKAVGFESGGEAEEAIHDPHEVMGCASPDVYLGLAGEEIAYDEGLRGVCPVACAAGYILY